MLETCLKIYGVNVFPSRVESAELPAVIKINFCSNCFSFKFSWLLFHLDLPTVIERERCLLRGLTSSSEEAGYVREWEKTVSLEIFQMQKILLGAELRKSSKTLDGSL